MPEESAKGSYLQEYGEVEFCRNDALSDIEEAGQYAGAEQEQEQR